MGVIIVISIVVVFLGVLGYRLNKNYVKSYVDACSEGLPDPQSAPAEATSASQPQVEVKPKAEAPGENGEAEEPLDTMSLTLKTLCDIGCQPKVLENGSLEVMYQGEAFIIECGGPYARIWDPDWLHIKEDDPKLPLLREAINAANFKFGPTVVMTRPNDEGYHIVHSRFDIVMHPALPAIDAYLRSILNFFFETKEEIRKRYVEFIDEQNDQPERRDPTGFDTDNMSQN